MLNKGQVLSWAVVFALCFAPLALAQDDPFGLVGYADGDSPPLTLHNDTEYEFAFNVFNQSGGEVAIRVVRITLPSNQYILDVHDLAAPEALHAVCTWWVDYQEDSYTIIWESGGSGYYSTAEIGDIREGEMLSFTFRATTDNNKAATDGFPWTLTGDDGGATEVSDVFEFGPGSDDDDDDDDDYMYPDDDESDDDFHGNGDDDDDDDDSSCGC